MVDEADGSLRGILGEHQFVPKNANQSVKFIVTRGDYNPLMALVVSELTKAKVSLLEYLVVL